jgi:8-oxo-dGTP diphosphatase
MTMRTEIYQSVSSITPLDELEKKHHDAVLQWIESGAELFRREKPATPEMHLVSYFMVVSPDGRKVLLVDHKQAELWLPPGGHVEPDEHPRETVRREALEELGIESEFFLEDPLFVTVTQTVGKSVRHTDVSLWYLLQGDPQANLEFDRAEFHQIRWFPLDEVPFHCADSHLKRFLLKMGEFFKRRDPTWQSYEVTAEETGEANLA